MDQVMDGFEAVLFLSFFLFPPAVVLLLLTTLLAKPFEFFFLSFLRRKRIWERAGAQQRNVIRCCDEEHLLFLV